MNTPTQKILDQDKIKHLEMTIKRHENTDKIWCTRCSMPTCYFTMIRWTLILRVKKVQSSIIVISPGFAMLHQIFTNIFNNLKMSNLLSALQINSIWYRTFSGKLKRDRYCKENKQHTKLNCIVPVCLCDNVQTEMFEKEKRLIYYSEKHLLNLNGGYRLKTMQLICK